MLSSISDSGDASREVILNTAPFLHPCNWPKYQASQKRAVLFARAQGSQILWVQAIDMPNTTEDKALTKARLDQMREQWLPLHDKKTAGIMGLIPCTWNLPVRFSHTLDKKNKIFKYARGRLVGWELHQVDQERVAGSTDTEILLSRQPRRLFVVPTASLATGAKPTNENVFVVMPRKVTWHRDTACNAPVGRIGFPVVPDFAGTIHSYTGESLETGIVDCLAVEDTPRAENQWKAYIGLSRLTSADGLLVAQPFAPMLFRQGPLLGPTLLMQFQRGEISVEQVVAAWKQATRRKVTSNAFKDVKWPCGRCGVEKKAEYFAPQKNDLKHFAMDTLLVRGAWRCCLSCHAQASPAPADKRWCDVC